MRYILIILLALATINGFGQSKPIDSKPCPKCEITTWNNTFSAQAVKNIEPLYYIFTGGINGKEMLKIDMPKLPIDSLVLHVRKSQLRWLNDSTAVIHKSN